MNILKENQFVPVPSLERGIRLVLSANTGAGKTVATLKAVEAKVVEGQRVIIVVHRVSLAREMVRNLAHLGAVNYEQHSVGQPIPDVFVCTIQSLAKFVTANTDVTNTILVVEEIVQTHRTLQDETMNLRGRKTRKLLDALMSRFYAVVVSGAEIAQDTHDWLSSFGEWERLEYQKDRDALTTVFYDSRGALIQAFLDECEAYFVGEVPNPPVLSSRSKRECQTIGSMVSDVASKLHLALDPIVIDVDEDEEDEDSHTLIADSEHRHNLALANQAPNLRRALIMSPVAEAGVSLDNPLFGKAFVLYPDGNANYPLTYQSVIQASGRVRCATEIHMYVGNNQGIELEIPSLINPKQFPALAPLDAEYRYQRDIAVSLVVRYNETLSVKDKVLAHYEGLGATIAWNHSDLSVDSKKAKAQADAKYLKAVTTIGDLTKSEIQTLDNDATHKSFTAKVLHGYRLTAWGSYGNASEESLMKVRKNIHLEDNRKGRVTLHSTNVSDVIDAQEDKARKSLVKVKGASSRDIANTIAKFLTLVKASDLQDRLNQLANLSIVEGALEPTDEERDNGQKYLVYEYDRTAEKTVTQMDMDIHAFISQLNGDLKRIFKSVTKLTPESILEDYQERLKSDPKTRWGGSYTLRALKNVLKYLGLSWKTLGGSSSSVDCVYVTDKSITDHHLYMRRMLRNIAGMPVTPVEELWASQETPTQPLENPEQFPTQEEDMTIEERVNQLKEVSNDQDLKIQEAQSNLEESKDELRAMYNLTQPSTYTAQSWTGRHGTILIVDKFNDLPSIMALALTTAQAEGYIDDVVSVYMASDKEYAEYARLNMEEPDPMLINVGGHRVELWEPKQPSKMTQVRRACSLSESLKSFTAYLSSGETMTGDLLVTLPQVLNG